MPSGDPFLCAPPSGAPADLALVFPTSDGGGLLAPLAAERAHAERSLRPQQAAEIRELAEIDLALMRLFMKRDGSLTAERFGETLAIPRDRVCAVRAAWVAMGRELERAEIEEIG